MKWLTNLTIKARMVLLFVLMMGVFMTFSILISDGIEQMSKLTLTLYEHPLRVSNAARKTIEYEIKIQRDMRDLMLAKTELEMQDAVQRLRESEKIVYETLDIVKLQILGTEGKTLEEKTRQLFRAGLPLRNEMIELVYKGERDAALLLNQGKRMEYVSRLEEKMENLNAYAQRKADGFIVNAEEIKKDTETIIYLVIGGLALILGGALYWISVSILSSLSSLKETMAKITTSGELSKSELEGKNEIAEMAQHFNALVARLQNQFWLRNGLNEMNRELSGDLSYDLMLSKSMTFVARYVKACAGTLYSYNNEQRLCELRSSYAYVERKLLANQFKLGEGLVGQVAMEKQPILLSNIQREDALGSSGTIAEPPRTMYAIPLIYNQELFGVLEIASFEIINETQKEFLDSVSVIIATSLFTAAQKQQIQELLVATQAANEEMAATNEELTASNEELQAQKEELRVQASELEAQRVQVQESDRLKSEFLSNMSHELRTPLNSVLALSQLMMSRGTGKNPQQEGEYLKVIERNGQQLLSLINDILDLSKIEAGRMDVYNTDFDPAQVTERALDTIRPLADGKGLKISFHSEDLAIVHSDEDKVHQILLNLLSNAVKFTKRGDIRVSLSPSGSDVLFRVQDTGIGISEKDFTHIFDEFRQVDGSTTRPHEGTGLGLAICQKLAKLLGGDILVDSAVGLGSTFTLRLPVQGMTDQSVEFIEKKSEMNRSMMVPQVAAKNVKRELAPILVIEDDKKTQTIIKNYLIEAGYRVITAENGKRGLELAHQFKPFAITLDVLMPEMDGWETLRQLKASEQSAAIPVIMITVSHDQETAKILGATGFVTKPVDKEGLYRQLEEVLANIKSQPVLQTERHHSLLVIEDNEVASLQISSTLTEEGYSVQVASGGAEGLECLKQHRPDAVILDLMMPGVDGFQVLEELRSIPQMVNLPVLVLTAKALTSEERARLSHKNIRELVQKGSLNREQLVVCVNRLFQEEALPLRAVPIAQTVGKVEKKTPPTPESSSSAIRAVHF
ncbi:response regulator [Deltaproteobacteria bacterium TL4]